jgi:hypothetical protein
MNGFVGQAVNAHKGTCGKDVLDPSCTIKVRHPDVMGYHDYHQIPNYWSYARHYVLQDHFFADDDGGACRTTRRWCRAGQPSARRPPTR